MQTSHEILRQNETSKNDCAGSSPLGLQVPLPLGAGRGCISALGVKSLQRKRWRALAYWEEVWFLVSVCTLWMWRFMIPCIKEVNILCPSQTYLYLTYRLEVLGILWRFRNSRFFQNAFLALKAFIKLAHQRFTVFSCVFFKMYEYFKFPASSISCLGRYTVTNRCPAFRNVFT